jgi:hypothetical protein
MKPQPGEIVYSRLHGPLGDSQVVELKVIERTVNDDGVIVVLKGIQWALPDRVVSYRR